MNILFTSPTYYPHLGGAESCIEDLATAYVQKGHKVTVITSKTHHSLAERENRNGIAIIRLNYPPQRMNNLSEAFLVFSRGLSTLLSILSVIREERTDVVCLGLVGIDSFPVLILSYFLRFKLIVYIHGGEIRSYVKVSPLVRWTLKRCLKTCYAAIAVSEELRDETIAFAPSVKSKILVIPNGVDLSLIREQKSYRYPRKYFLYVGRLHPIKGISALIEAFNRVSAQAPELDLLIVGTGFLDTSLKRMVTELGLTDRIFFLGARERSEVYALLKGCEFLVLPSYAEGCPVVLLEAMAAGKMTIGSRAKGIANIIQHEENGVLFDPGQVGELGNLILRYHTDHTKRSQLEENIRTTRWEMYDIRKLCERHLEAYAGFRQKLRICLISDFYYQDENCTGLASYYFNLAKSLSDQGHDVYLVTSEKSLHTNKISNLLVVRTKRHDLLRQDLTAASAKSFQRLASRLLFSFKAYLKVKELSRSLGVDIICAAELFAPALFVGLFMGNKLITRIHSPTYLVDHYNDRYRYQFIGRLLSVPEKAQAKMSRGLSVASECLASTIERDWSIPKENIHVIPNSIQIEWVRQLAAKQSKDISGDYLLYFGRFEKRKGVHIISQALSEVFATRPKIKIVFIGKDCGLKEVILRENWRYQERIIFFGTMEKERLFGAVRYAKLVLLPSLFENLSNAGLEAMALEKPLIATRRTSFEEIIEDNVNGFLVEPGDAGALSAKILSCLEMRDLEQIGQNAYQSILRLDSQRIALDNIEFYCKTILGR